MKLPVKNAQGEKVKEITVDDQVFGLRPNLAVLHQAFVAQRANQRRGTASTKTRGEVTGSTRKVRSQKYTGRARQGSARAPHRVGGGVVFGPRPRDYSQRLPKRMKRLAIRSALSGKVADGQLTVIDQLAFERPKTKEMLGILHNLGIQRSALIVTGEPDRTVLVCARNLAKTKVLPAAYLNVADMLSHRDILMTEAAVRWAEALWGGTRANQRRAELAMPVKVEEPPKPRRRRPAQPGAPPAAAQPAKPKARAPKAAVAPEPEKPKRRAPRAARKETLAASAGPAEKPQRRPSRRAAAAEAEVLPKPRRPRSASGGEAAKE